MTVDLALIERCLELPTEPDTFAEAEPVRCYLAAAIAPGTPLAVSAHLRMGQGTAAMGPGS